jgi:hypothetical protein
MSKAYQEKVRHIRGVKVTSDMGLINAYITVVSRKLDENTVQYQVAYCSPHDTFVKKEGVRVARNSDKVYTVSIKDGATFKDINFAIIVDMVKNREDAPKVHRAYLESIFDSLVEGF